jgi:hypothetical protein
VPIPVPTFNNTNNGSNNTGNCQGPNQFYNGNGCVCLNGYYLQNNNCLPCQANSLWNGNYCQCNSGYYASNGNCIYGPAINCPSNSVNNGLGVCICLQPSQILINSSCQSACPSNQQWNGSACVCSSQLTYLASNGSCEPLCSQGRFWDPNSQTCIAVCGVNMVFDSRQQKCVCNPGFGIGMNGQCEQCSYGFQNINGYCVTCPAHAAFSPMGTCECESGYAADRSGICVPKCQPLEMFNAATTRCDCRSGLGRVAGVCTLCPSGTYLVGELCSNCPANAVFFGQACICNSGYILDPSSQRCISCTSLTNSYWVDNRCIQCPGQQVYNQQTRICQCPSGLAVQGSRCVQSCQLDELADANGACYSCPLHMVPSNGICVCAAGYVRDTAGCGCVLTCGSGQFIFMGGCASCPLNTRYAPEINGCVCPIGWYWSGTLSYCLQLPPGPTYCPQGQYFSNTTQNCTLCPNYCSNCSSSGCVSCMSGYYLNANRICQDSCGDGIVTALEACDTGSVPQPGCISCRVTAGYTCSGQPSVCVPTTQPPVVTNTLTLFNTPSVNANNVFISLKTTPTFTFPNEDIMKSFIRVDFGNSPRASVYCLQRTSP